VITRRAFAFAVALLALGACTESADAPNDPVWGKEACSHCTMLVSSRRYAAQIVTADGSRRFFDDIGCMVSYVAERGAPKHAWVRDADGDGWLDARAATYRAGAASPMDFGFEASRRADLSLDDVQRAVAKRNAEGRR
jgi:copper chaperone NosL